MLLGNKKSQKTEENWCLILNPLQSELDKRIVSRKISEAFSLSPEEANDLVNNTPIILLDNMPRALAAQVKDYFRPTGAEMLMTNDTFLKRKCYRTVWPEPPNLSFLNPVKEPVPGEKEAGSQELHPEEALNEIRSLNTRPEMEMPTIHDEMTHVPPPFPSATGDMVQEIHRLKKESDLWREKYEAQKRAYDNLHDEAMSQGNLGDVTNAQLHERDREIERQRAMLTSAEDKYEGLQEEYRQARILFEEKMTAATQEVNDWKNKADELLENLQIAGREKSVLEQKIQEQSKAMDAMREKQMTAEEELSDLRHLRHEKEFVQKENQKRNLELEQNIETLKRMLKEEQMRYQKLVREHEEVKSSIDEQKQAAQREIDLWKAEIADMAEKVKPLERNQGRLIADLESRTQEAREWELKSREFEESLNELKSSHENLEKMLAVNLKHLENRERELESTRRQLRDVKLQMEQRDASQRRAQLIGQLADKESRLKDLVREQEKVESEIREREESIKKILSEQEKVEKEIIEGKQAQRHYLEQSKKERMPRIKINKENTWDAGAQEASDDVRPLDD